MDGGNQTAVKSHARMVAAMGSARTEPATATLPGRVRDVKREHAPMVVQGTVHVKLGKTVTHRSASARLNGRARPAKSLRAGAWSTWARVMHRCSALDTAFARKMNAYATQVGTRTRTARQPCATRQTARVTVCARIQASASAA